MALAIATRCFSPPDNFKPRSPTYEKVEIRKNICLHHN